LAICEERFFKVSVETFPWKTPQLVGYYASEDLAHRVAKIVSDHNMDRVMGGVGLRCEHLRGDPQNLKIVVKTELDVKERDRVISLRFGETLKRNFEEEEPSQPFKKRKLVHQVSVKTHPWNQNATPVGYYAYRDDAQEVARLISDHNMQRLKGGIDVFCNRFAVDPIDPSVVVNTRLDVRERDRIMGLRFKEGPIEMISEDEIEHLFGFLIPSKVLYKSHSNAKEAAQNFAQGAQAAQKYAQETYGSEYKSITFSFQGTGICPSSVGPQEIDPSVPQMITCIVETKDGLVEFKEIGAISLETLKTANEVESAIRTLIDHAFRLING